MNMLMCNGLLFLLFMWSSAEMDSKINPTGELQDQEYGNLFMWSSAEMEPETKHTGERQDQEYEIESRVNIQTRKNTCSNLGGKCIKKKKDCPSNRPLKTKPGRPYCSKRRRCCYPDNFLMTVKTGDGIEAGINSRVLIVFEDHNGKSTEQFPINNLYRGGTHKYTVPRPKGFGRTVTLKIVLDDKAGANQDWYCDYIFVVDPKEKNTLYFPIDQRIGTNLMYEFQNYATSLPQLKPSNSSREQTLSNKRKEFQYSYTLTAAMVKNLPRDEQFGIEYHARFLAEGVRAKVEQVPRLLAWKLSGKISSIYWGYFYLPESIDYWREDAWFGAQRVQGILPNIIQLCSKIPDKFGVTEDTVNGLLGGSTLQQALESNKIFITDLELLDGIQYNNNVDHASPIALFYLNERNILMPIAIQLRQLKGPNNPIYTPKDPSNTWLVAKMFYNNAEAQLHEIVSHFSFTHLIMDGFATCMNRRLSSLHPIYKLLKPHFLYLMAINKEAEAAIFSPGGDLDLFSVGTNGTKPLNAKAVPLFTFERAIGSVESDATARGVWDEQVLPYYPFRDDAFSTYRIIKKYVTTIVNHYYHTPSDFDRELQEWRRELGRPRDQVGVGIPGLPGDNISGFSDVSEVIDLVTMIITQSSVGHAAVNFPQYDTYGYVPNYPADMKEGPPHQKVEYTEDDIWKLLPDKKEYLGIMGITRTLSWDGTNELGDFEKEYLFDPVCREAHKELRKDLKKFSKEVKKRNRNRLFQYKYLDPDFVPNATSI